MIANFGGPRSLEEVEPFLVALFSDREVFRVPFFFNPLFKRIAKRRAIGVREDYRAIGGKSPIFEDTEVIAKKLQGEACTFHRYLVATHDAFFKKISSFEQIIVFPMFPQFTYATTGSIAMLFAQKLPKEILSRIRWVKSYPKHPAFIALIQKMIREFFEKNRFLEEETILIFSAHGLPKVFIDEGDVYQEECESSFQLVSAAFPKVCAYLSYQSKVGRGEWIRPYTVDLCQEIPLVGKKDVLFIPISFTSDHIETLFEIEREYMPIIRKRGLNAHRLSAFNQRPEWIEAIGRILREETLVNNAMLVR